MLVVRTSECRADPVCQLVGTQHSIGLYHPSFDLRPLATSTGQKYLATAEYEGFGGAKTFLQHLALLFGKRMYELRLLPKGTMSTVLFVLL
jgi:hypothetical protein